MKVKRIVANICVDDLVRAKPFYAEVLGLEPVMDLGWIATYAAPTPAQPQISLAIEDGAGTAVPDLSIEVDDLEEALRRCRVGGFTVEYAPAVEPWEVRRFHVRDPFGRLVNIVIHTPAQDGAGRPS